MKAILLIASMSLIAAGCSQAKARDESKNTCDPNYSGCVPVAGDVDCYGGKGDGPAFTKGPVTVVGSDIYRLDGDGDGIACDKK